MNIKNLIVICILISCFNFTVHCQDTNLARLEYTNIPQSKSDNAYSRFGFSGNYPIKLNDKGSYLVLSFEYRFNHLQLEDPIAIDKKEDLQDFQTFGFEVGYTYKMKNDWRFGAKLGTRISSNFESSGVKGNDFRYTGSLFFVKKYGKKDDPIMARLVLGLRYTTPASIMYPLPIINYYRKFHPKWAYALGTPKTSIKYFFNDKNTMQAFVGLDRFYGNVQNNRVFVDDGGNAKVIDNASMLIFNGALGYEFYFTEHLLFFTYGGYTLSNEIRFRDKNQKNILTINDKNTFYIRGGIKLKL